jgi:hypothetical protein
MLIEQGVATTESDGPPCFFVYAPRAVMKFRAESVDVTHRMITMCYNEAPTDIVPLHGKFWALIESINGGEIPDQCFLKLQQKMSFYLAMAYNRETFEFGLGAAPYRTGIGKFAAQFKPNKPFSATIAIESGIHGEHGAAILFEQSTRRCLITRRILGLSDEETFWDVMKEWANFDPSLARPRKKAGQIFYPAEYSHMFEAYWDFIQAPTQEAAGDSKPMGRYASAVAQLDFSDVIPLVDVEAPEKSQRIAHAGAMSRRYPVQYAQDYFSTHQEQAQEECDTVANGFAPEPDVHNVHTGSGDPVLNPT